MSRPQGFTLLELLIVMSIAVLLTAGASLALPPRAERHLDQEAQRLITRLEIARSRSRARGQTIVAQLNKHGMNFIGSAPENSLSGNWLHAETSVQSVRLVLGPEPVITPQHVQLRGAKGHSLWVATDGVRPFAIVHSP